MPFYVFSNDMSEIQNFSHIKKKYSFSTDKIKKSEQSFHFVSGIMLAIELNADIYFLLCISKQIQIGNLARNKCIFMCFIQIKPLRFILISLVVHIHIKFFFQFCISFTLLITFILITSKNQSLMHNLINRPEWLQ